MGKYSKIRKCELCGLRFAFLPCTLIVSQLLRPMFCEDCGLIIFNLVRKQRKVMREMKYAGD